MNTEEIYKFIEIVHGEEMLWNVKSKGYKDTSTRTKLWKDIGAQFEMTGEEAYKYFRKLREKYRREVQKEEKESRSGSGFKKGSPWIFKKHLDFLNDAYKGRKVNSSVEWNQQTEDSSEILNSDIEFLDEYNFDSVDLTGPTSSVSSPTVKSMPVSTPSPLEKQNKKVVHQNNIENIINSNTQQLIQALKDDETPFDGVIEFIKETLKQLDENRRKILEKELG